MSDVEQVRPNVWQIGITVPDELLAEDTLAKLMLERSQLDRMLCQKLAEALYASKCVNFEFYREDYGAVTRLRARVVIGVEHVHSIRTEDETFPRFR